MDISLSEAVAIARKWESEETKVNAYMENTLTSPSDKGSTAASYERNRIGSAYWGTDLHCSGLKLEKKRSARGDSSALGSVEIKATS